VLLLTPAPVRICLLLVLIIVLLCQACVSRYSAYSNTVVPGNTVCYKSVVNSAGTGCGA